MTDVGRSRTTNEDAYAVTDLASGRAIEANGADRELEIQERGVLLALSDGMGGAEAGEVASALVLDSLQKALERDAKGAIEEQLEAAVQRANRNVFYEAKLSEHHGMGATLVALFVRGDEAYIAEVGDSRGYLLRNGRLRQITRDQSLVQMLIDQGVMSPAEARKSSSKNVILQAIGLSTDVRVAIARLRLRRGDRFLMCSDGITNPISDPELQQILTQSDPRAACQTMIALANDRGGDDNQTAIVADLTGDGLPLPDEFETVTETYEVIKRFDPTYKGKAVTAEVASTVASAVRDRQRAASGPSPEDFADERAASDRTPGEFADEGTSVLSGAGDIVSTRRTAAGRGPAGAVAVDEASAGRREANTPDGATAIEASVDGASADGASADGASADGASADGASADGASADGASAAAREAHSVTHPPAPARSSVWLVLGVIAVAIAVASLIGVLTLTLR